MILTPSFWRSTRPISGGVLICIAICYLQALFGAHPWTLSYALSLSVLVSPIALISWMMFVPRYLYFSDSHFSVEFFMRERSIEDWDNLKCWGNGNGVFILQFDGGQTYQILPTAYSPDQWSKLIAFVTSRYPDRKANGWFGPWGF